MKSIEIVCPFIVTPEKSKNSRFTNPLEDLGRDTTPV
jgi:hypothetical protein